MDRARSQISLIELFAIVGVAAFVAAMIASDPEFKILVRLIMDRGQ